MAVTPIDPERRSEHVPIEALDAIRSVTADEVAFFRDNGWAHLEQLLPASVTDALLAVVRRHLGDTGDDSRYASRGAKYTLWPEPSNENALVRSFSRSRQLARVTSALNGTRRLRWYVDSFIVKLGREVGGSESPWHQDYPQHSFDRAGMTTMWVPLVDCPPEKGTMRFLNGSRAAGPLGRFGTRADGASAATSFEESRPDVLERYGVSPPLHLRVGDVTVHDGMTVHTAPSNTTDSARWVYSTVWFPADALYNGAHSWVTDGLGLQVDEPFDDGRFPVVTD